ncbi:DNA-directed RNA polymerase III subunit rpc4-like isoform X4 [Syzygium oleosum]|uniref:DNA-directed RNA polymerase III subunit rpc4-like isoform X4 n=1 Tax=Syzygium oleosum TaxID=219896 RepID=UPI0024B91FDA|nr:DNA-directed RNA polymerase III subunit rpc4-like isoform X4 [Syzygium oleosum]
MDSKPVSDYGAAPRKVRFAPKAPPVRRPKPAVVKTEVRDEDDDEAKAKDLLRHFNEGILKEKPKFERKVAPSQIAFGYGGTSSSLKSYHAQRDQNNVNSYQGSSSGPGLRGEKEYREPWLLSCNSSSKETIFRKSSQDDGSLEPSMFFIQLPPTIPMAKRLTAAEGNETTESSTSSEVLGCSEKSCSLDELSAGLMGKMLVYRSGAVKLKLGDTLYDVSSGLDCVFAQDVVAINKTEKHFCVVGELNKRAILTPDVGSILDGMNEL